MDEHPNHPEPDMSDVSKETKLARYDVPDGFDYLVERYVNGGYYVASEADAAISALASRLAEAEQLAAEYRRQAEEQRGKVAEAERRVKELEGALWKYGDHFPECFVIQECGRAIKPPCNCGYDAALSPRHQSAEGAEGEGT